MKSTFKLLIINFITLSIFSCSSDDSIAEVEEINYEYTEEEKQEEIARVKQYIANNGYENVQETASGLHYIIEKQGDGLYPDEDDDIIFHFETTNMEDDKIIGVSNREENEHGQPNTMRALLNGVAEGFQLVNEGSVIRMFVPSFLAFGKFGSFDEVQPKTNMMFTMELNIVLKREDNF